MEDKNLCLDGMLELINFNCYSKLDIVLMVLGTLLWIVAYYKIIVNAFRHKFVEMPVAAGAFNIAWEFVWAFLIKTDLGVVFQWGLRIWFLMDIFIFIAIMRFGRQQVKHPTLHKHFVWIQPSMVLVWAILFWLFHKEGYDTGMGATSAFMITVPMSWLFISNYLNNDKKHFSPISAWSRVLGDYVYILFLFVHYHEMWFLKALGLVVAMLDAIYLVLIINERLTSSQSRSV